MCEAGNCIRSGFSGSEGNCFNWHKNPGPKCVRMTNDAASRYNEVSSSFFLQIFSN